MAGRPSEHGHLNVELEQMLLFARRWNGLVRTLADELACEPVPGCGVRYVAGRAAQIKRVLVVLQRVRVQRVAAVAMEVTQLWRRDDEGVKPFLRDKRADRVQPRAAVGSHGAEEREADAEVVQELGALTGKIGLLILEVTPRDHAEPAWQIHESLSTAQRQPTLKYTNRHHKTEKRPQRHAVVRS